MSAKHVVLNAIPFTPKNQSGQPSSASRTSAVSCKSHSRLQAKSSTANRRKRWLLQGLMKSFSPIFRVVGGEARTYPDSSCFCPGSMPSATAFCTHSPSGQQGSSRSQARSNGSSFEKILAGQIYAGNVYRLPSLMASGLGRNTKSLVMAVLLQRRGRWARKTSSGLVRASACGDSRWSSLLAIESGSCS